MLKRYLVFEWGGHNESGGWNDFTGSFQTIEQAQQAIAGGPSSTRDREWDGVNWQIVDAQSGKIELSVSSY